MKERFSRDLLDAFNKKVCLHWSFLRKLPYLFFFPFGKFWSVSRKIRQACVLAFLKSFFLLRMLARTKNNHPYHKRHHCFGENNLGRKRAFIENLRKSDFSGCTPILVQLADFRALLDGARQIQPKNWNFKKFFFNIFIILVNCGQFLRF